MRHAWFTGIVVVGSLSTASANAPIIGGTTTTVGEFPTVVAVRADNVLCTGTLIAPQWVLTAAHCISAVQRGLPSQEAVTAVTSVRFDTVDLAMQPGRLVPAAATIPKPQWTAVGLHDIGLIKLQEPIVEIAPTPVNFDATRARVGVTVTMVGFGLTSAPGDGGMAGVQYALADRRSTSCVPYGASDTNLLCYSQADFKGKCLGDSGGPSFAQIDGRAVIVGVGSFNDLRCEVLGGDTRTDVVHAFLLTHIPELVCQHTSCEAPDRDPVDAGLPDPKSEGGGCCDANGGAPTMVFGILAVPTLRRRRRR